MFSFFSLFPGKINWQFLWKLLTAPNSSQEFLMKVLCEIEGNWSFRLGHRRTVLVCLLRALNSFVVIV